MDGEERMIDVDWSGPKARRAFDLARELLMAMSTADGDPNVWNVSVSGVLNEINGDIELQVILLVLQAHLGWLAILAGSQAAISGVFVDAPDRATVEADLVSGAIAGVGLLLDRYGETGLTD